MKALKIGNRIASIPIIQGGMGVGVSRGSLAGAVAKEGGIGVISTAQIGYDERDFEGNENVCNLRAIGKHIAYAKELAQGAGLIGVNIMVALKHYSEHVKAAVKAKADIIICGAGLPMELPGIVRAAMEEFHYAKEEAPALAPIVSSEKAARIIFRMWKKKYNCLPDMLIVEGPKAGGHLGFSKDQLDTLTEQQYDEEIKKIINCAKEAEKENGVHIPVVVAGGIYDRADVSHAVALGAEGVQVASRFVATYECDASEAYKQAYIQAQEQDLQIVQSPVGMPGRALRNPFIAQVEAEREPIRKCYQCLEHCNPAKVPYCITKALINAVKGDINNGLIFCGANVGRIREILSVHDVIQELLPES
ncbi:MAG: nitronate monooxygenase [Eubacterium sp.]|nr:nitronate monooxygenase [Eubacterium sp.]